MINFLSAQNLVTLLQKNAIAAAQKPACLFIANNFQVENSITYAELDKKARAIAAYLQHKNLTSQRILLLYPSGLNFIAAFLGCLYAGVIAVPLACPQITEFKKLHLFLKTVIEDTEAAGILTDTEYFIFFEEFRHNSNLSKLLVIDTQLIDVNVATFYQLPHFKKNTIAYLQYTSGSTANSKAVVIQHKQLIHNVKNTAKAWHYTKQSISLTWAPHSHIYGLICGLLTPLSQKSLAIIMSPHDFIQHPASWLQAITKYKVTHSGGPNFGYDLCIQQISAQELENVNLKSWLVAVSGGEIIRSDTVMNFYQKFSHYGFQLKSFCPAYGMSELTGTIASNYYGKKPLSIKLDIENLHHNDVVIATNGAPARIFLSNGRILPGLIAHIVDPDTLTPVTGAKIGEIWLSGKSVASGYWKRLEETQQTFHAKLINSKKTYFRTGDLGFIKQNQLFITGRLKDIFIQHGKKYYLPDIEISAKMAISHLPVANANTSFVLSHEGSEEYVFIQELISEEIPENQLSEIIKVIRATCAEQHGIDVYGVILVNLGAIPKTSSGKIQRGLCHKLYLENKLEIIKQHFKESENRNANILSLDNYSAVSQSIKKDSANLNITSSTNLIDETFIHIIATTLNIKPHEININDPVNKYGFDSINILKLASELNKAFNINITPAHLFGYHTLADFYNNHIQVNEKTTSVIAPQTESHLNNEIAIIGMSGIFPGANDLAVFWDNLINEKSAIKEIPQERWDWKKYYGEPLLETNKTKVRWGGFIDGMDEFDASFFNISPREAELIDPQQRLFLQTVWKTIEDAGYSINELNQFKTGVFAGIFSHDYAELLHENNLFDAYSATGLAHTILSNRISYLLNLQGPSVTINTACSSSLVALHQAVQAIQNGDCEIAIAGGVNGLLTPSLYLIASKAGMLSEDGKCKTFDKAANGFVRGEGAGAILLKPLAKAHADGDHIYGIIKGTAVNHGGQVSSLTVPNPNAQSDVIVTACNRAAVPIDTITYVETHGTGTSLGDPIEINALKQAFNILHAGRSHKNHYCGLGSVKTNIGHLESAAGIVGVIKVLLAMQHKKLPATINFNELNPYIELNNTPFYIVKQKQDWLRLKENNEKEIPLRAGISSFGFGGTNAHVIIEECLNTISRTENASHANYLITLSAKTEIALDQRIKDLYAWLLKQIQSPNLADICFTLNRGRNHWDNRCAIVVNSINHLQQTLKEWHEGKQPTNCIISTQEMGIAKNSTNQINISVSQLCEAADDKSLWELAKLYIAGHAITWQPIPPSKNHHRISLPVYPFAKTHYWFSESKKSAPLFDLLEYKQVLNSDNALLFNSISHEKKMPLVNTELAQPTLSQSFIQLLANLLKISPKDIDSHASLSELGLDSIAQKELAAQLENQYGIQLTPAIFFTYPDVQKLSHYLINTYPQHFSPNTASAPIISPSEINHEPQNVYRNTISTPIPNDEIAIIGMQAYLPQSNNVNEFWIQLLDGKDFIGEIPADRWDWREYYGDSKQHINKTNSKWGGFINHMAEFDAAFFNISTREANLMDPQHRLFLEIVWKTIEDAGYDPFTFSESNMGIFAGLEFSEYQELIQKQQKLFHGHLATGNSPALLTNRISYFLNLHGPSETIDTACSSSLVAIHRAANAIKNGECKLAIAGGVSLMLDPQTLVITSQLGALSPEGRCKTFDKSANGYVKGEGIAAVLLKPLAQAKIDGDFIYGLIKSSVVNHGGKAQSLTAPNAAAQTELLIKAYTEARIDPQTVTYIETHGTGTELGDPIEIESLKQAFATLIPHHLSISKPFCGLGAVKTNIGHLEPASGIASVIKVLLAMQHKKIPGNLHLHELNPYIQLKNSLFYLIEKTQDWNPLINHDNTAIPRRAGISSFGFGGTNAHVVLEEFSHTENDSLAKPYYLITLSAKQENSLRQKFIDLLQWLHKNKSNIHLADLSYTLNVGRSHFNARCAMVVTSIDELITHLECLIAEQTPSQCLLSTLPIVKYEGPVFNEIYQSTMGFIKNNSIPDSTYYDKLFILADLYIKHFSIDFNQLYRSQKYRRIAGLPGYPFIKQHYWFDKELNPETSASIKASTSENIILTPISTNNAEIISDKTPQINISSFTLQYLQNIFAEKLKLSPQYIDAHVTYEEYGIDSLLGVEITERLQKDFGDLSKTLLYEYNNIHDLAAFFQKKYKSILQNLSGQPIETIQNTEQIAPIPIETKKTVITNDIAIIGLSGTYPLAKDIDEFWENLLQGRDCITEVPLERWNYKDYPVSVGEETKYFKYGGFIADADKFDPLFFKIAPTDAALMDPQERLFLQSTWTTLEDAGYTREKLQQVNNEVGVFVGVTYNFYPLFIAEEWAKGNRLPLDIQMFSVANRVSYFLNLNGPSYPVDTACSSALAAIHLACESILRGECQMAIAGGVNLSLHPSKYHFLGSYSFMSDQGKCASFAEGGQGYVPSEGVGTVLLKPLASAIKDNDRIYGIIKSTVMNHGGKTSGYTVPNPNAQANLIKSALEKSQINPRSISYIEAHGTGTALGDPIEIRGLQQAFERHTQDKQFCAIGSVKSNIGHLESAAGISQLTKVLLQMRHKKLVPSLHAEITNPYIDFSQTPFYVQKTLSAWETDNHLPRRAGISSFGAGGTNVHIIIEEYIPAVTHPTKKQIPFLFLLSAQNMERLQEYAQKIYYFLIKMEKDIDDAWLTQACYTSQVGRESMPMRLAIAFTDFTDFNHKLKSFIDNAKTTLEGIWLTSTNSTQPLLPNVNELIQLKRYEALLSQWINGAKIDWDKLYADPKPQKIFLPTYPFAKRRCWVPTSNKVETKAQETMVNIPSVKQAKIPEKPAELPIETLQEWLYETGWELKPLLNPLNIKNNTDQWLIFSDKELGPRLKEELGAATTIYCFSGDQFQQLSDNTFCINPQSQEDYKKLFNTIFIKYNLQLKGIIYFANFTKKSVISHSNIYYHFIDLLQSLISHKWQHQLQFCLITANAQSVSNQDPMQIWQHPLWALLRTFAAEQAGYRILLLDLDNNNLENDASLIPYELYAFDNNDNHIVYRNKKRYALRLKPFSFSLPDAHQAPWNPPEAVLITGGLGALGIEVAHALAIAGTRYFLLTGTSALPERSQWSQMTNPQLTEKIQHLISLENHGVHVIYAAADVCHKEQMQFQISEAENKWHKKITGVFHLAGVTTDNIPIINLTKTTFENVLEPKIQGTVILHEIFEKTELEYFVLFSSIAALPYFGMRGLSAYTMANSFLNGFAAFRQSLGLKAMSINWTSWADKGMSFKYNHSTFLNAMGMETIEITDGMAMLRFLLKQAKPNVTVFKVAWSKFFQVNQDAKKIAFFNQIIPQESSSSQKVNLNTLTPETITEKIVDILSKILGIESNEIDQHTAYQDYGLDSINGIHFVSALSEYFPDVISPMDLYRYTTVNLLAEHIIKATISSRPDQTTESDEIKIKKLLEYELQEIECL